MQRKFWPLFFLCLSFLSVGCSQLNLVTDHPEDEIFLSSQAQHSRIFTYSDRVDFYLWGLYPAAGRTIYADELLRTQGIRSASEVELKSYQTWRDWVYTVVTLGMYAPVHFDFSAYHRQE